MQDGYDNKIVHQVGFNQFGLLITIDNDSELHKNKQLACVKFK